MLFKQKLYNGLAGNIHNLSVYQTNPPELASWSGSFIATWQRHARARLCACSLQPERWGLKRWVRRRCIGPPHPPSPMWCQHKSVLSQCLWPLAAWGKRRDEWLCLLLSVWYRDDIKRGRKGERRRRKNGGKTHKFPIRSSTHKVDIAPFTRLQFV